MGTAIAARDGGFSLSWAMIALLGAILVQVGTNLANDYFDFVHGADTTERVGPRRATQAGLVSPQAMRAAFVGTFAAAALVGVAVVARGGWPFAAIAVASIACGVLYTGGPKPLGYLGLGDLLVLVFFGPVAVAGTHYLQTLSFSPLAAAAGLAPGLLSTALLAVNNLRDIDTDRRAGKATVAVRFGRRFAKAEYAATVGVAALVPVLLWRLAGAPLGAVAATAVCLSAVPALRTILRARPGDRLLAPLAATGRLLVLYGVAFSVGWVAGGIP
jgi:1,4-dihydroxy-2-naphthoate octaprenyltransferase